LLQVRGKGKTGARRGPLGSVLENFDEKEGNGRRGNLLGRKKTTTTYYE